ncbi:Protein ApaG [Dissostichus eleginoides]|uniref:Protein ApaG n=1 Tax=Dissostichus eleginoides TaxID=100907 RepID=A0AAD9CCC1_DISEL|nr:Protein ApaG [Dissostichus eleginoides]
MSRWEAGSTFQQSSSLVFMVEKLRPDVNSGLGGAEGGGSSGRSTCGAEASGGATPKGKKQGCLGAKLGKRIQAPCLPKTCGWELLDDWGETFEIGITIFFNILFTSSSYLWYQN